MVMLPSLFLFPVAFMVQAANIAGAVEISKGNARGAKFYIYLSNSLALIIGSIFVYQDGLSPMAIYLGSCFISLLSLGIFETNGGVRLD